MNPSTPVKSGVPTNPQSPLSPKLTSYKKPSNSKVWLDKVASPKFVSPENSPAKKEKSKWTVPTVMKQLKTGKLTIKFLEAVRELLEGNETEINAFVKADGFEELLAIPDKPTDEKSSDKLDMNEIRIQIVWIVAATIGTYSVSERFLDINSAQLIQRIIWWSKPPVPELRTLIFNFCTAAPFLFNKKFGLAQAYWLINQSMDAYRYKFGEKRRFEHIMFALKFEESEKVIESIIMFSNMLVNLPDSLADRMSMRSELRGLHIESIFDSIQLEHNTPLINEGIKQWYADADADEDEYKGILKEFVAAIDDVNNRDSLYDCIVDRIMSAKHIQHLFDEIMKKTIALPIDTIIGYQKWLLLERVIRQLGGDEDQITFDNREHFVVKELLSKTESEAKETIDHQKLLELKSQQDAKLYELKSKMKDAEEQVVSLEKINKLAKEAAKASLDDDISQGLLTPDEQRKIKEEQKLFEKEFGGKLSEKSKNFAFDILSKLHNERRIRVIKKNEDEEIAREIFKTKQRYDDEKLFTRSRIKQEIEADKREQIAAAKANFAEELAHLKVNLQLQHDMEMKEIAATSEDKIVELEKNNKIEYNEKTLQLEEEYEKMVDEERSKAGKSAEDLAEELDDKKDELKSRMNEAEKLENELQEAERSFVAQELHDKKIQENLDKQTAEIRSKNSKLNEKYEEKGEDTNKIKQMIAQSAKQLDDYTAKLNTVRSKLQEETILVNKANAQKDDVSHKVSQKVAVNDQLRKQVADIEKVIKEKDAALAKLEERMQKVIFLSGLAKAGPQLSNTPPPQDLGNAPMRRGGPPPRGALIESIVEEEVVVSLGAPDGEMKRGGPRGGAPRGGPRGGPTEAPSEPIAEDSGGEMKRGGGGPPRGGPRGGPAPRGGPRGAETPTTEGESAPSGEMKPPPPRGGPAPRGGPRGGPAPRGGPPKVAAMVQNVGVKPTKKMKPFHWNKLRGGLAEGSLFDELKPTSVNLDIKELEELFCQPEKVEAKEEKPKKVEKITFVEGKQLQQVAIYLKQFQNKELKQIMATKNMKLFDLMKYGCLNLDKTIYNFERVAMMAQVTIEAEALGNIKNWFKEDPSHVDDLINEVDLFFYHVYSNIPKYTERMKCMAYVATFEELNKSNIVEVILFQKGLRCLRNASRFKKILEIILVIGNFLNHATRNGDVEAYDLDVLEKLADFKCSNGPNPKYTMLDFVYENIEKYNPDVFLVIRDLEVLDVARKASWDKAENGINEMKGQLATIQKICGSIPIVEGDKFQEVQKKIEDYAREFSETCLVWEDVQREWKNVANMYCKDTSKVKPETFFNQVFEFIKQFQTMRDNIEKKKLEEEENEKKKQAKASQQSDLEKKKAELAARKAAIEERKRNAASVPDLGLGDLTPREPTTPLSPSSLSVRKARQEEGILSPRRSARTMEPK